MAEFTTTLSGGDAATLLEWLDELPQPNIEMLVNGRRLVGRWEGMISTEDVLTSEFVAPLELNMQKCEGLPCANADCGYCAAVRCYDSDELAFCMPHLAEWAAEVD